MNPDKQTEFNLISSLPAAAMRVNTELLVLYALSYYFFLKSGFTPSMVYGREEDFLSM